MIHLDLASVLIFVILIVGLAVLASGGKKK